MMDFLTVSIESKGMEEYLWGINLKSMQFIYIKMDDNIRKANFKLGDVLSFSEKYCGQNRHEFTVDGEINVEKRGRDALYNILEFKALYPIGLLEQTEQDRVLKIESVKDIIPGEFIYMYVKVFGLAETYKVVLTDAKWIAYWKNKHFKKDVDGTISFLNHVKDMYLVLDYSDYGVGTEIHSCGMVLNYE